MLGYGCINTKWIRRARRGAKGGKRIGGCIHFSKIQNQMLIENCTEVERLGINCQTVAIKIVIAYGSK
jgi:hypothetical protein